MKNKVLVIGDYKTKNADSCTWSESIYNLTDYETVIIDTSCLYKVLSVETPGSYTMATSDISVVLRASFKFIHKKILECLSLDTTIYVLYYPDSYISYGKNSSFYTNDWCPIPLKTCIEDGTTINIKNKKYQQYLGKLKQWNYYYLPTESGEESKIKDFYTLYDVNIKRDIVATNKLNNPLAMELIVSFRKYSSSPSNELNSRIILLPITNKDDASNDIDTIIGLTKSLEQTEAPEWVNTIDIPNESRLKSELDSTEQKLVKARDNYEHLIIHKRLLFDYSYSLQNICEVTLRELGATTKPSVVTDEFIIEFKGKELLIEVKGKSKSIDKDDIGQLITDIGQHVAKTGKPINGLFIGNGWRTLPLENREKKDCPTFPTEIVDIAVTQNVGLLSTSELFKAYCACLDGRLTKESFLKTVFGSSGIIKF
ncbi:MAG: hypothetical protein ACYDG5_04835 [Dehalococcoidales bacterium]